MSEIAIGIDIGGTFTKMGAVDVYGNLIFEGSMPTESHKGVEDFLSRLYKHVEHHIAGQTRQLEIVGIGIGAPNANFHKGTIEYPANLPWPGVTPLVYMFQEYYPHTMLITNDANAAAVGEMLYGAAKGMQDFVLLTLGTGLGSGIVASGELINGHDGFAGEMGHVQIVPGGRECGCGRRGCLETYVSATGIRRTIFELLAERNAASDLRKIAFEDLTADMISQAAQKGDPIAMEAFEFTGRMLGMGCANTVAYLSPQAIFLWGGLAKAGHYIFDPTRRHMEAHLMKIYRNKVKILPSGLEGKNIAVLGAAALVWKEVSKRAEIRV